MSFLTAMTTDNGTVTTWHDQSATTAGDGNYVVAWTGLESSIFDGYEWIPEVIPANQEGQKIVVVRDEHAQFQVNTVDWPHRVQWGDQHRSWVTVTLNANDTQWHASTAGNDVKTFNFYYTWVGTLPDNYPNYDHIHNFTVNFGPIAEMQEVAPESFMKWLEKIGHDYAFLRMNHRLQKKMMKDTGQIPPWDPRKIEELEERRIRFRERMEAFEPETREQVKQRMRDRWGIDEIPSMTPELLDKIAAKSLQFLESCLSPEEMKFFDEHGHCKIPSSTHPEVYYIVKVTDQERVERYVNDQLAEKICIHSKWGGLPPLDTLAMKTLYIKNAETEFLKVGNRTKVAPRAH